jgi:hypothetical protein
MTPFRRAVWSAQPELRRAAGAAEAQLQTGGTAVVPQWGDDRIAAW